MKRPLQGLLLKENARQMQATSEQDAIKKINQTKAKAKGFQHSDQAANDQSEPEPPTTGIVGNDSTSADPESEPAAKEDTAAITTLTQVVSDLKQQLDSISTQNQETRSHLDQTKTALKTAQEQLEDSNSKVTRFSELFDAQGSPNPVNTGAAPTQTQRGNSSDTASEFVQLLEDDSVTPTVMYLSPTTGEEYVQRDTRTLFRYFQDNRQRLRSDMEVYARNHGLLRGARTRSLKDAVTLKTDVPDGFLVYLSMVMRETHLPKYIYWQFASGQIELGKGPGDTIHVPRWNYLPDPEAVADYELTPGVPTNAQNVAVSQTSVPMILKEYGRGKTAAQAPVSVPEFIQAYSLLDVESAIRSRLGQNYMAFQDLALRSLYFDTTKVIYNNGNRVSYNPADLSTGDKGTLTQKFLDYLYAELVTLQIPTYDNGYYAMITHPLGVAQIKDDMTDKERFTAASDIEDVTNALNMSTGGEMGRVTGYVGTISNFMIFVTNAHSVGAPGSQGVQNETISGGPKKTRTSVVFGRNPVAQAIGMPAELRRDNNDDFQRLNRYIWLSHASYGHLDTDPQIDVNAGRTVSQQLRVAEVRTLDEAL